MCLVHQDRFKIPNFLKKERDIHIIRQQPIYQLHQIPHHHFTDIFIHFILQISLSLGPSQGVNPAHSHVIM